MKKKVNKICIVLCDHESSVAFQVKGGMKSSQNFMITKLCLFWRVPHTTEIKTAIFNLYLYDGSFKLEIPYMDFNPK